MRKAISYRGFRRNNAIRWIGVAAKRSEEDQEQIRREAEEAAAKKQNPILLRNRENPLRSSGTLYTGFYPEHPTWEDLYRSKRVPETGTQTEDGGRKEATSKQRY